MNKFLKRTHMRIREEYQFFWISFKRAYNIIITASIFLLIMAPLQGEKWFRHYGVSKNDNLISMTDTKDGGFIFVGSSTTLGNGRNDLWVMKTDDSLRFDWQRFYGGPFDDIGKRIFSRDDGFLTEMIIP